MALFADRITNSTNKRITRIRDIRLFVLFVINLSCVLGSISQTWTSAFPFEEARPLYVGSRPLAMGNAFTAIADDAEAGFWNPAGLVQRQGVGIFASTKMSDRQSYAFDSKCVAYSYRDTAFFWGNKIVPRGSGGETPDFTYYSLARKLSPHVAMGSSAKFRREHPCEYYQFFGHSPGYDLGILWKPDTRNSGGMLIQNMGDEKLWVSVVTLGFAHRFANRSLLSVDAATRFGDGIALEPHVGYEWHVTRWMALRVGVSDGHPTAGAGLKLCRFRIDYAWIRNDEGNAHFLSGQVDL
jgi:hypothetical protein